MTNALDIADLAHYPGVSIPSNETGELVVRLTNGIIGDIIGDPTVMPVGVVALALEVAARALQNPSGAESITTGIDDWKKTIRFKARELADRAGVYLSNAEKDDLRELLNPTTSAPIRRVKSVRTKTPGVRYA